MPERSGLSPLERRILAMSEAGFQESQIAVMFRRSPRFIRQVISMAGLRKDLGLLGAELSTSKPGKERQLSARQRVVMRWRQRGASYAEIASRLRRTPLYVRRIESIAQSRSV